MKSKKGETKTSIQSLGTRAFPSKLTNMASTTGTVEVELSTRNNVISTNLEEAAAIDESDTADILAASRLADSTVPEGGYGWVVIFACSVITFWFVGTTYSW